MTAKGIYVFAPAGGAAATVAQVKAGPFTDVAGFDWLAGWNKLEPSKGVYDFSVVDDALDAADAWGKHSQLCLLPGFEEPAWLLTSVPTIQIQQFNTGKFVTMCNPVSPAYLTELCSLIAAFGLHNVNDGSIDSVQCSGLGDQGEMVMGKPVNGEWADYGVTPATLLAAWQQVINAWYAAFPHTVRSLAIEEPLNRALPMLGELITWIAATHPMMALQQNGLSDATVAGRNQYWLDLQAWHAAGRPVGWQMFAGGNDALSLAQAFTTGLAAGGSFFQIYLDDILNPANATVLQTLAVNLAKRP